MKRLIVLMIVSSAALVVGVAVSARDSSGHESRGAQVGRGESIAASEGGPESPSLKLKPGTRKLLDEFEVGGRKLRLETASTVDGGECLMEVVGDGHVTGSMCFDGGLLDSRKVAFSVSSDGGPDRFRSLYIVGVASPGVASIALARTDGSTVRLELARNRAFVFESPASDLDHDVLPAGLELFGPSGRRIDVVDVPALR